MQPILLKMWDNEYRAILRGKIYHIQTFLTLFINSHFGNIQSIKCWFRQSKHILPKIVLCFCQQKLAAKSIIFLKLRVIFLLSLYLLHNLVHCLYYYYRGFNTVSGSPEIAFTVFSFSELSLKSCR